MLHHGKASKNCLLFENVYSEMCRVSSYIKYKCKKTAVYIHC